MNRRSYYGIDLFRFIAAFTIIGLHVNYANLLNEVVLFMRMLGRFGVPFFFMISGFFFEPISEKLIPQLKKLLNIIFIANFIYFLGFIVDNSLNSLSYINLIVGVSGHLWFLNSLFVGLIVLSRINKVPLVWLIGIALLFYLIYILVIEYQLVGDMPPLQKAIFRNFISIPFLIIGFIIKKKLDLVYSKRIFWFGVIALLGFFIQFIEIILFYKRYNISPHNHEFLVGSLIYSIGVFCFAVLWKNGVRQLAVIGKEHSLFLYLYHPLFIIFLNWLILNYFPLLGESILKMSLILVFVATFLISLFFKRYFPPVFNLLNGRFIKLKQIVH